LEDDHANCDGLGAGEKTIAAADDAVSQEVGELAGQVEGTVSGDSCTLGANRDGSVSFVGLVLDLPFHIREMQEQLTG
jgi:hypothetical protein